MTWLKFLNYFILQWFFIRLAKMYSDDEGKQFKGYCILKWVVPLSGWGNKEFKYL